MSIITSAVSDVWRKKKVVVPALSSVDVFTTPTQSYKASKYFLEASNSDEQKYKGFEIWSSRKGPADVVSSIFARLGDSLQIELNIMVVGSDIALRIVNNENFDLEVSIVKSNLS